MKKWTLYEQYLLPGLDTIKAPKQVVGLIINKANILRFLWILYFPPNNVTSVSTQHTMKLRVSSQIFTLEGGALQIVENDGLV